MPNDHEVILSATYGNIAKVPGRAPVGGTHCGRRVLTWSVDGLECGPGRYLGTSGT